MRRSGYTLIELILSIGIGSTFLLGAITLMHRALTISETASSEQRLTQHLRVVADQFRRDARSASSVEQLAPFAEASQETVLPKLASALRFTMADGTKIEWRSVENAIWRTKHQLDGISQANQTLLQSGIYCELKTLEPQRVALRVSRDTKLRMLRNQTEGEAVVSQLRRTEREIEAVIGCYDNGKLSGANKSAIPAEVQP